jgi:AcrR family transcriptional regulator
MDSRDDADAGAPGPQTQAERRATAERRLLKAATTLIAERGLERFTLAEVGLAAGYSSGLPAHYFGKKDSLVAAVARNISTRFSESLDRRLSLQPGLEGLLVTVGFYFDSAAKAPIAVRALTVLVGEALNRPDLAAEITAINRMGIGELERQLRYGIDQGRIRTDIDVESEAMLMLASMRGAIMLWLVEPKAVKLAALRDAYVTGLRRRLSP